jgi:hypothetical protein
MTLNLPPSNQFSILEVSQYIFITVRTDKVSLNIWIAENLPSPTY